MLCPFIMLKWDAGAGKTTVRDKEKKNGLRVAETEIDLLAVSRDTKEYLVGECKFKKSPFNYSEYLATTAKLTPLKEKAKFYYALFSESGLMKRSEQKLKNRKNFISLISKQL